MSALDELTDVFVELTGSELPTHLVCYYCYPIVPDPLGGETRAMCGALLAGINRDPEELDCEPCIALLNEPCPRCSI